MLNDIKFFFFLLESCWIENSFKNVFKIYSNLFKIKLKKKVLNRTQNFLQAVFIYLRIIKNILRTYIKLYKYIK